MSPHLRDLAADLRPMTLPMALTLGRLALVPVFLLLVVLRCHTSALALFFAMAVSDNLDGRLARRWGQTTRLGMLLDPLADKVLVSASMVLLAFPRFAPVGFPIPYAVPLGVFLKDLGVMIGIGVVWRMNGRVELNPSRVGKVCTTIQLVLVTGTLLAPALWWLSHPFAIVCLWTLAWATVLAAAAAGVDYSCEGARQLRGARASAPVFEPTQAGV